jgi:aminopeptidase N
MKWWDDIWLNEGFATWAANKPLEAWKPEWNVPLDEVSETQQALGADSLPSTRAIRLDVETPDEINEVFDAIAYEKTASVLRMVERYVGPEPFRRALTSYLRKYAFSNAAGEDFWNEVARVTGKAVDRIMGSFVTQAGAPVLSMQSTCTGASGMLEVKQGRFTGTVSAVVPPRQTWTLPVCPKSAAGTAACRVLATETDRVPTKGCDGPVFANTGGTGYFLSEYAPDAVHALLQKPEFLSPSERLSLLGDEWAMVRAGRHDAGLYLETAAAFASDEASEVAGEISQRLGYIAGYLLTPQDQQPFRDWVRRTFGPAMKSLGVAPAASDSDERQSRRAALIGLAGTLGNDAEVQKQARDLAMQYLANSDSVPGTLVSTLLRAAASAGDTALYDRYLARMRQATSDPDEYYRFFNALPSFTDPALVDRTLELSLTPEVRSQDVAQLVGALLTGGAATRDRAWAFVKANWPRYSGKLDPFQGLPNMITYTGAFCSKAAADGVRQFFAQNPVPPAERSLRQTLERIESCAALEQRQSPVLSKWLSAAR